jgi:hypothetical protein
MPKNGPLNLRLGAARLTMKKIKRLAALPITVAAWARWNRKRSTGRGWSRTRQYSDKSGNVMPNNVPLTMSQTGVPAGIRNGLAHYNNSDVPKRGRKVKLKESVVTIEIPGGDGFSVRSITLSGLFSEWLFASKFWAQINAHCGTIFGQYEEDEVREDVVEIISAELAKRIQGLSGTGGEIEFVHGWDVNRTPLVARINVVDLVREITEFREFLDVALKSHVDVYVSL